MPVVSTPNEAAETEKSVVTWRFLLSPSRTHTHARTFFDKISNELLGHRRDRDGGGLLQNPPALPALEAPRQRRRRPVKNKLRGWGGGSEHRGESVISRYRI